MWIGGPSSDADMPGFCERARVLLEERDDGTVVCDVGALARADLLVVAALARLQLAARRVGREVRLRHASDELRELLEFTGLSEVLPLSAELRVEPRWKPEEREQPLGVEEHAELDDPSP